MRATVEGDGVGLDAGLDLVVDLHASASHIGADPLLGGADDRVIARVRESAGNVLLFSSGHFLRVLATRWCGLDVTVARHLLLSTASVSLLGYDHNDLREPAIKVWNHTA